MSDRGYHVSKAGLTTHHLESLGNLTAYLLGLLMVQVIKIHNTKILKQAILSVKYNNFLTF